MTTLETNKIYQGDVLAVLKTFPNESVDCIITSPPYYGLRDYGAEGQIGLEPSLNEYIDKMLLVTGELKRVLKKTGTMFWNHGDSYSGDSSYDPNGRQGYEGTKETNISKKLNQDPKNPASLRARENGSFNGIPSKSLLLQAHRLAIRMVDEQGWILRNQIIWHKSNCMPSSVEDRFTVDFEPMFFFTKSKRYYFEQQYEPQSPETLPRLERAVSDHHKNLNVPGQTAQGMHKARAQGEGETMYNPLGRNKRSVWKINTQPYSEAHFAVFPKKLVEVPIKSGCPPDGIVLDPFFGSGTTGWVAKYLGRQWVGIELSPKYIAIAQDRFKQEMLF